MSYNPTQGFPRIMPALRYADVGAALAWLSEAFGLKEHLRWTDEQGVIRHAEMRLETAFIEVVQAPPGERSPRPLAEVWQSLVVLVDNVDAHYHHARATGATIIAELQDKPWGLRQYTALDLQGHQWEFSQHLRDVPPAQWGGSTDGVAGSGAHTEKRFLISRVAYEPVECLKSHILLWI